MAILLNDVWQIDSPKDFKLHFARWNGESQPLEVWARDKNSWQRWQEYRPAQNAFNRPFIFALAQFYHEPDIWLFGGIYRVIHSHHDRYEVELTENGEAFNGRLKLRSSYRERATRVNFENHYSNLEVQEILPEPYSGRRFVGFEDINLSFEELESIVHNNRLDWKAALSNVKGIYLISDVNTGRRYIGSAYGDQGIWSRWCNYVATGHGGNVELRALVSDPTLAYCRKAFRFALLEFRAVQTPDDVIIGREAFWKNVLLTRGDFGLNRN
jgi:hypothetical protein